jgi:hypothetical protein
MRVSSTPQLFASITIASEYWIVRSSRTMTASRCRHFEPPGLAFGEPDDRLREAIHCRAKKEDGLLRRKRSSQ